VTSNQGVSTQNAPGPPQAVLDVAAQVADAQRGSLLEELGWARDAVEAIVTIVETVAEASFFTLFFEMPSSNDVSFS
jgi:hypothetical protein